MPKHKWVPMQRDETAPTATHGRATPNTGDRDSYADGLPPLDVARTGAVKREFDATYGCFDPGAVDDAPALKRFRSSLDFGLCETDEPITPYYQENKHSADSDDSTGAFSDDVWDKKLRAAANLSPESYGTYPTLETKADPHSPGYAHFRSPAQRNLETAFVKANASNDDFPSEEYLLPKGEGLLLPDAEPKGVLEDDSTDDADHSTLLSDAAPTSRASSPETVYAMANAGGGIPDDPPAFGDDAEDAPPHDDGRGNGHDIGNAEDPDDEDAAREDADENVERAAHSPSYFRTQYANASCVLTWLPSPPSWRNESRRTGESGWKLADYKEQITHIIGDSAPDLEKERYKFKTVGLDWKPCFLYDLIVYFQEARLIDADLAPSFEQVQGWFEITGRSRKSIKFHEERVEPELLFALRTLGELVPPQG